MRLSLILASIVAASGFAQPIIQGPMVLVVGAPGAGKSTQAAALAKIYKLPIIASEELIKTNADVFAKIKKSTITGMEPQTDPVMNKLFEVRIQQPDVQKGVIVAGYPATKDHADFLVKLIQEAKIPNPTIIQLDVPDEEVRKRLANDPSYTAEKLEQLLKDYHREFDMLKLYFPNAEVYTIDGRPKIPAVTKKITEVLDKKLKK